jgi:hypothetical protein
MMEGIGVHPLDLVYRQPGRQCLTPGSKRPEGVGTGSQLHSSDDLGSRVRCFWWPGAQLRWRKWPPGYLLVTTTSDTPDNGILIWQIPDVRPNTNILSEDHTSVYWKICLRCMFPFYLPNKTSKCLTGSRLVSDSVHPYLQLSKQTVKKIDLRFIVIIDYAFWSGT